MKRIGCGRKVVSEFSHGGVDYVVLDDLKVRRVGISGELYGSDAMEFLDEAEREDLVVMMAEEVGDMSTKDRAMLLLSEMSFSEMKEIVGNG